MDRRTVLMLIGAVPFSTAVKETKVSQRPTIARIWRGRTRPGVADQYEVYLRDEGIPPLRTTALVFKCFERTGPARAGSPPSPIGRTSSR
jgi:hypothetical protein